MTLLKDQEDMKRDILDYCREGTDLLYKI